MTDTLEGLFTNDDVPPSDPIIVSSDRECEVCGTPLLYSGKGRPPTRCDEHKRSGSGKRGSGDSGARRTSSSKDVDAALASLDQLNGIFATVFMFASPSAAAFFAANGEKLEIRNRTCLEANPELAKKIAKAAGKTGGLGLVISYGMVLVPAFGIMREERAQMYASEDERE